MALKPANLAYAEAAAVPGGGQTALQCLRKGHIQSGQKVLIYGASGAVGTYAVQLAIRHFGAEVTGVCRGVNLELVKSLGASQVMDYARQDFTLNRATYDVVFDAVGKLTPARAKKRSSRAASTSTFTPTQTTAINSKTCSCSKN